MAVIYIAIGVALAIGSALVLRRFLGFRAQRPEDYAGQGRTFDIREHLDGSMICEGVIYGPAGRVTTRFVAEMDATWQGDTCRMTEAFHYDTGGGLSRAWTIRMLDGDRFEATAPDIIGTARGRQTGSAVQLKYAIRLPDSAGGHVLDTTDWMYLMENGSIINRSQMRKFGLKVGELVAMIRKAA